MRLSIENPAEQRIQRALEAFRADLSAYRRYERKFERWGCGFAIVLLLAGLAAAVYWLR